MNSTLLYFISIVVYNFSHMEKNTQNSFPQGPELHYTREAAAERLHRLTEEDKEYLDQELNGAGYDLPQVTGWFGSATLLEDGDVKNFTMDLAVLVTDLKMAKSPEAKKTAAKALSDYICKKFD